MPRTRFLLGVLGLSLLAAGLAVGLYWVRALEARELLYESTFLTIEQRGQHSGSTKISARVGQVKLSRGEHAMFELCAQGDLTSDALRGAFELLVWRPAAQKLELKVGLDDRHRALVKRGSGRSCLTLGGGRISATGDYALDVLWAGRPLVPALARLPVQARVLAKQPLGLQEGVLVLCAALGAVLCSLAGFGPTPPGAGQDPTARTPLWAVAFAVIGMVLFALALRLPVPGALGGFARGLSIAAVEVALAMFGAKLLFRERRSGLRLYAPTHRAGLWLLVAAACALLLRPLSTLAMQLVPRTGEAPIEAFISWPSGALTFALLGMVVPLAEELFFRGLLFGALSPLGKPAAIVCTIALFAAAHAQQAWGNWGALVSVTLTGVVLTLLRAYSGSTLVPAVAHVLFNLSLWRDSFAG